MEPRANGPKQIFGVSEVFRAGLNAYCREILDSFEYSGDAQSFHRAEIPPSSSARPDYWDVMHYFDGLEHRMQLSALPPPTIWVNGNG